MPRVKLNTAARRKADMVADGRDVIRNAARAAEIRNTELAERCSVRRETVSRWWGDPQLIPLGALAEMAVTLGLEIRVIDPTREQVIKRER